MVDDNGQPNLVIPGAIERLQAKRSDSMPPGLTYDEEEMEVLLYPWLG